MGRDTQDELDNAGEDAEKARRENEELKERRNELKEQIRIAQRQQSSRGMARGNSTDELGADQMREELQRKEQEYQHLGAEIHKNEAVIENLEMEVDSQNSQLRDLDHFKGSQGHARHELEHDEEMIGDMQGKMEDALAELNEYKLRSEEAEMDLQDAKKNFEHTQEPGKRWAHAHQKMKAGLGTLFKKPASGRKSMASTQQDLMDKLKEEEAQIEEDEARLQELRETREELTNAIMEAQELVRTLEEEQEQSAQDMQLQLQEMKNMMGDKIATIEKLEQSFNDDQAKLEEAEAKAAQMGIEVSSFGAPNDMLGMELGEDFEFILKQIKTEKKRLKQMVKDAEADLVDSKERARKAELLIEEKQTEIPDLKTKLDAKKQEMKDLGFDDEHEMQEESELDNDPEVLARKASLLESRNAMKGLRETHGDAQRKADKHRRDKANMLSSIDELHTRTKDYSAVQREQLLKQHKERCEEVDREHKAKHAAFDEEEEALDAEHKALMSGEYAAKNTKTIAAPKRNVEAEQAMLKMFDDELASKKQKLESLHKEHEDHKKEMEMQKKILTEAEDARIRELQEKLGLVEKQTSAIDEHKKNIEDKQNENMTAKEKELRERQKKHEERQRKAEERKRKEERAQRDKKKKTTIKSADDVAAQKYLHSSKMMDSAISKAHGLQTLIATHAASKAPDDVLQATQAAEDVVVALIQLGLSALDVDHADEGAAEKKNDALSAAITKAIGTARGVAENFPDEVSAAVTQLDQEVRPAIQAANEAQAAQVEVAGNHPAVASLHGHAQQVAQSAHASVIGALALSSSITKESGSAVPPAVAQELLAATQTLERAIVVSSKALGSLKVVEAVEKATKVARLASQKAEKDLTAEDSELVSAAAEAIVNALKAVNAATIAHSKPGKAVSAQAEAAVSAAKAAQLLPNDCKNLKSLHFGSAVLSSAKALKRTVASSTFDDDRKGKTASKLLTTAIEKAEKLAAVQVDDRTAIAAAAFDALEAVEATVHRGAPPGGDDAMQAAEDTAHAIKKAEALWRNATSSVAEDASQAAVKAADKLRKVSESDVCKQDQDAEQATAAAKASVEAAAAMKTIIKDHPKDSNSAGAGIAEAAGQASIDAVNAAFAIFSVVDAEDPSIARSAQAAIATAAAHEATHLAEHALTVKERVAHAEAAGADDGEHAELEDQILKIEAEKMRLKAEQRHAKTRALWHRAETATLMQLRLKQLREEKKACQRELQEYIKRREQGGQRHQFGRAWGT